MHGFPNLPIFCVYLQAKVFENSTDPADQQLHQTATRIQDMGRCVILTFAGSQA